jgi:hypothetical protein
MAVQNQAGAYGTARRTAAWAVRGTRHRDRRRAFIQPLLDVDPRSDNSYLAPSFQDARSTTRTRSLATGGPRHLLSGQHCADAPSFGLAS